MLAERLVRWPFALISDAASKRLHSNTGNYIQVPSLTIAPVYAPNL